MVQLPPKSRPAAYPDYVVELKLLRLLLASQNLTLDIVPSFLLNLPSGDAVEYVDRLGRDFLPAIRRRGLIQFADVTWEEGSAALRLSRTGARNGCSSKDPCCRDSFRRRRSGSPLPRRQCRPHRGGEHPRCRTPERLLHRRHPPSLRRMLWRRPVRSCPHVDRSRRGHRAGQRFQPPPAIHLEHAGRNRPGLHVHAGECRGSDHGLHDQRRLCVRLRGVHRVA